MRSAVDGDPRILLDDRRQRAAALEPHLEPQIVEPEHQAVGGALRHADGEYARQAAPDGEVLIRIDQRIDQLADAFFRHLAQREHGVGGDRIPRQQRDDVRHQRRGAALLPCAAPAPRGRGRASGATGSPGSRDRAPRMRRHAGIARGGSGCVGHMQAEVGPRHAERPQHQRPARAVLDVRQIDLDGPVQEALLERLDVAAIQTAGGEHRGGGAGHRQRQNRRGLRRRRDEQHRARPGRRRPRRPAGRTRRR